jgi:endo-1,4-beta-xylanase
MRQNLKRLGELGVQVHITEMDVKVNDNKTNTDEQKLKQQADVYSSMMSVCLSEPNCKALLTWGVADKHSYIRDEDKTEKPLLFDDQYKRKPAYEALLGILERKSD